MSDFHLKILSSRISANKLIHARNQILLRVALKILVLQKADLGTMKWLPENY